MLDELKINFTVPLVILVITHTSVWFSHTSKRVKFQAAKKYFKLKFYLFNCNSNSTFIAQCELIVEQVSIAGFEVESAQLGVRLHILL